MSELYLGLISGTSLDGVDAALADFTDGRPSLAGSFSLPYPDDLLTRVRRAADPAGRLTAGEYGALDARLGEHFAQAALALIEQAGIAPEAVRAIGSHGQTVAHDPDGPEPYSVQLADPNRIAERTGILTVADFRRRDIAAGGQGAPLMCALHDAFFRRGNRDTAVLNLGGIANLTLLPADPGAPATGFDSGPANCLLDAWARRHTAEPFDRDGALAAGGTLDRELLAAMLADPYLRRDPPKTTGTQYFSEAWLDAHLGGKQRRPADVAATLAELTAASVAEALTRVPFTPEELVCCGGGARNPYLMERLAATLPSSAVTTTEALGLPPEWVEAVGFAWLARQTLAGRAGNLPSVTHAAGPRVLGAIHAA